MPAIATRHAFRRRMAICMLNKPCGAGLGAALLGFPREALLFAKK